MKKNPPELYGVKYLKKAKASKALNAGEEKTTRWEDNGTFYGAAMAAYAIAKKVKAKSILDVGCGRGFVVRHLRKLSMKAEGCEYGTEAVKHSVCDSVWGDLTGKLPYKDNEFDMATSLGVLSHLPEEYIPNALAELSRVSAKALWTNILILFHPGQEHHLTVKAPYLWKPQFVAAGWQLAPWSIDFLQEHKMTRSHYGWSQIWLPKLLVQKPA